MQLALLLLVLAGAIVISNQDGCSNELAKMANLKEQAFPGDSCTSTNSCDNTEKAKMDIKCTYTTELTKVQQGKVT